MLIDPLPAAQRASHRSGLAWGFTGVIGFSLTVPLTQVSVATLDPLFVGAGRAVIAGLVAGLLLLASRWAPSRRQRPRGSQWLRLGIVVAGVVAGFPLLTSVALQSVPSSHAAVVIGLLPAATAVAAVLRGGERPGIRFWTAALLGALAVTGFTVLVGGTEGVGAADLLLIAAVMVAAVGYAEGALLSREIGSWQTICWALVLGFPVMLLIAGMSVGRSVPTAGVEGWLSFAYLSLVSMLLGFFAWYRGLAIGPIATVSQVQLVQPVLTLVWSFLLLGETITAATALAAGAVIACAALAVRSRVRTPAQEPSPRVIGS